MKITLYNHQGLCISSQFFTKNIKTYCMVLISVYYKSYVIWTTKVIAKTWGNLAKYKCLALSYIAYGYM